MDLNGSKVTAYSSLLPFLHKSKFFTNIANESKNE